MIIIDGRQSQYEIASFANLEELLAKVMEDGQLQGRVITDVIVNDESFSELYPHQAEDMDCAGIERVEIKSQPMDKMARDMAGEMPKVATLMANGARNVGRLFREDKQTDALELLQDLLDVTRDFMAMLTKLRDQYLGGADEEFVRKTEELSNLTSEMSEVMESEDWVLLSDLLEYELAPLCEDWRVIGEKIHKQLEAIA
ncbi:MAG: hypothetical protein HDQ44_02150 [Desulfovibrio sp.]|nr:hypothetical protein [Desulfovibrio sp.]